MASQLGVPTTNPPEMVGVLGSNSCGLSVAVPDTPAAAGTAVVNGNDVTVADTLTVLAVGDVVGYLNYAVAPNGPGSLGRLKAPGLTFLGGRGTVSPVTKGFTAPANFGRLKNSPGQIAGGAGGCAE